jgi:predicted nucleic acid-binding protein
MIRKVFLDTNILIDWLTARKPFVEFADKIFMLHVEHGFDIFVSALSLANIAYTLDRRNVKPHSAVAELLQWIKTIDLTGSIIADATKSEFSDFEDGLQYFSAKTIVDIDVIITRNKKDFKYSSILVQSPEEFVLSFNK